MHPDIAASNLPADQPITSADQPLAGIEPGMTVVDKIGQEAGTVTAVQQPGTGVRPDTVVGAAEQLMVTGYVRIDGSGHLSNDVYASGEQIAGLTAIAGTPGVVSLRIARDELHRATS